MTIQKFSFMLLFVILSTGFAFGQKEKNKEKVKEKLKSHQIAFITQKLELTEEEAQKFWPIYNNYQAEKEGLKASIDLNPSINMSDADAEKMMYSMLDVKSKEIDIQKKYIQKMKLAIPLSKVAMLFKAEREFREKMIEKIKDRRTDSRQNRKDSKINGDDEGSK